jgi:hypothetical protein
LITDGVRSTHLDEIRVKPIIQKQSPKAQLVFAYLKNICAMQEGHLYHPAVGDRLLFKVAGY